MHHGGLISGSRGPRWVHHHGSARFGHVVPLVTPGGSCGVWGSGGGHFAEGSLRESGAQVVHFPPLQVEAWRGTGRPGSIEPFGDDGLL